MKEAEILSDIRFLLNQLKIQDRWQDQIAIDLIEKKYNDCELLTRMMRSDIEESYADPSKIEELSRSPFPTNQFTVSCETEVLPTAKAYAE
jgi:hypothetical protein